MSDHMDPQVSSAIISTSGGLLTGIIGMFGVMRRRETRRSAQDQRCERVCANLCSVADTLVAVIRITTPSTPAINAHLAEMERQVAAARAYLEPVQ